MNMPFSAICLNEYGDRIKYILFIRRAGRIFTTMFEKDGAEV